MRSVHLASLIVVLFSSRLALAETWSGYDRDDFTVDGRECVVVRPHAAAVGKPWIWRTEFFGREPQVDLELLARGFHLAYMNVQNMYGAPVALDHMDRFYETLARGRGLANKTVLEGFSRGGLFAFNWAVRHADRVAALYVDAPVCDLKSWPGKHRADKTAEDWKRMIDAYGFKSDQEAIDFSGNPADNLKPLADARIPILSVCGEADDLVPIAENTRMIQKRYNELGGSISVITKPFGNHHPHSLRNATPIVNFILTNTIGLTGAPIKTAGTPYGYDYFVHRSSLDNSRIKFEREKTGRVVFLGGSITNMKGWRDLVCQDLQKRFPNTKFDFINAGIPSLGSTPGAFRFSRDVLAHGPVDLLFEEAAVNDEVNGQSSPEQVRGMEGIIRQARLANPLTDIVMLHFVDPPKMEVIRRGDIPAVIVNHEKVAVHYVVSSIDLAQEVAERIHAGEFTWEKDFKDLHPAPFGQQLYANSVARLLDAAWSKPLAAGASPRPYIVPAGLVDRASYDRGRLVAPAEASHDDGWKLVENWKPADGAGTRPGFVNVPALVAEQPGATLHLKFSGNAIGIFVAAGPDAGIVQYSIDGASTQSRDLYTKWSAQLHLPWAAVLAADLPPGDHELQLRVGSGHNEKSKGTAVRIIHFLVNGLTRKGTHYAMSMSTHAPSLRRVLIAAAGAFAAALVIAGCASSNPPPQDDAVASAVPQASVATTEPATTATPASATKAPSVDPTTQPVYAVPYRIPKTDEIAATLQHVRDRLDGWAAIPQSGSMAASNDRRQGLIGYPMGVAYAGMLAAYEATGDQAFADFDAKRFEWIAEQIKKQSTTADGAGPAPSVPGGRTRGPAVRGLLRPNSLDSCGAMNTAFVKAKRANIGPDMSKAIDIAANYVSHKQFRLDDGTLARNRPFKNSLWGDDMYMGTALMSQMGALTGERSYFDDAAKNIIQMSQRLFVPSAGLFTHAWNAETGDNQPRYYWGRANGWNIVAMAELLSVLPEDHPQRDQVLKLYRAHAQGLANVQSGSGLWHQMLDRSDSYLEESCSAMFTYAIARGVNRGWLSSEAYGAVAISGWNGVTTLIATDGRLKNVCPGTSYADDFVYYYHRPAIDDIHGYGPTLLAGAEIIKLLKNDRYRFESGNNAPLLVMDKKKQPTSRD